MWAFIRDHKHLSLMMLALMGLLFMALIIPAICVAPVRSKVSRVRADLRSLGKAIEAYYIDNEVYPPAMAEGQLANAITTPIAYISSQYIDPFTNRLEYTNSLLRTKYMPALVPMLAGGLALSAFLVWRRRKAWTPRQRAMPFIWTIFIFFYVMASLAIADETGRGYLYNPNNPEKTPKGFRYYTDGQNGWILLSPGPNLQIDFIPQPGLIYKTEPLVETLLPFSYDPTNGTISTGDIWRVSQ